MASVKGLSPEARLRFEEFERHLSENEPNLRLVFDEQARSASIVGSLSVDIGAGVRHGFDLAVRFDGLNPFKTPQVWDEGRRFRPDGERHVEDHGAAGWRFCLELDAAPNVSFDLDDGLDRLLSTTRGFIRKQLMYEDRKRRGHPHPWPGEAWPHGTDGYVQWLDEVLPNIDAAALRRLRPYLISSRLSSNKMCPCGSGKRAGLCHREAAATVRGAPNRDEIKKGLDRLILRRRQDEQSRKSS